MKNIIILLKRLYGINKFQLINGLSSLGFSYKIIIKYNIILSDKDIDSLLNFFIFNFVIDTKLKDKILIDIRRLKILKTYKGKRHSFFLPVHGQHSKTNARTQKNKKK